MKSPTDIKACIFDLDGVIVDTAHFHFLGWKRLADELNIPFTEEENEKLKGVPRMESLAHILGLGNIELPESEKRDLAIRKNEWYKEYIKGMDPDDILPGVTSFIDELHASNIQVAIASSSKNAGTVVDKINYRDKIQALVDGNMVKKGKPDPELFLLAASMLNVDPHFCVVFEDAYSGIEAALKAEMRNIGIGEPEYLNNADFVIPGFSKFSLTGLKQLYLLPV
ncbi:MAG: beta-phosphoglucomutase [Chitinophagales bacterium]|nr:beta-phosphoglucomutase [Chitinophagales bacterium]